MTDSAVTLSPARGAPADAVLVRDYERLKPEILRTLRGKLAARGVRFDEADLDAFYNQAWHGLYARLAAGEEIGNRSGLLVTIAERRALDELRSLHPERRADVDELGAQLVEPDLAARLDDHVLLKRFAEGLRDRLSQREREAAVLCYVHDYRRSEAASILRVSPRRMEKLMDAVSKKVGAFVRDIQGGEWCESRASLIKAYALGMLDADGDRYRLAADHLDDCSACRHRVLRMRGLAAVTPPVPGALALLASGSPGTAAGRTRVRRRARNARNAAIAMGAAGVLAAAALAGVRLRDSPLGDGAAAAPTPSATARAGGASSSAGAAATRRAGSPRPSARAPAGGASSSGAAPRRAGSPRPRARPAGTPRTKHKRRRTTRHARPTRTATPAATVPAVTAQPAATSPPAATVAVPASTAAQPRDRDGAGEFELR